MALYIGVFVLMYARSAAVYLSVTFTNCKIKLMTLGSAVSQNKQSSRAQFWMFLISTVTFLLSTADEAAEIAPIGITIYSVFVGNQNVPLENRRLLVYGGLQGVDIVLAWSGSLLVRFLFDTISTVWLLI